MRAPEASRMAVKLAASISVSRKAARQSSELLAKASIAKTTRSGMRRLEFMIFRTAGLRPAHDYLSSKTDPVQTDPSGPG
ncbi:hypothetical protein RSO01_28100 [Reyranella soli]|uniref:Uncharacterized protein n=1 Tax=Reyranella soli TaxID=1230389 RepID=A0A512N9J7_9HYPH|nr:hypothetical protein RSO01_28100 [Reyranella soli]